MDLLDQRFGSGDTWITYMLGRGEVSGSRVDGDDATGAAFREDDALGIGGTGSTGKRREGVHGCGILTSGTEGTGGLVFAGGGTGEVTGHSTEIGFQVYEVAGNHGDFVAADEAEGITGAGRMKVFLGNLGVATGDDVAGFGGTGNGVGEGAEVEHCLSLCWVKITVCFLRGDKHESEVILDLVLFVVCGTVVD